MASYEQRSVDQWWIDRLDPPTQEAFEHLQKSKELQDTFKQEVAIETARVIRRLMKQKGFYLTPPEACDLADAITSVRWVLDTWTRVAPRNTTGRRWR